MNINLSKEDLLLIDQLIMLECISARRRAARSVSLLAVEQAEEVRGIHDLRNRFRSQMVAATDLSAKAWSNDFTNCPLDRLILAKYVPKADGNGRGLECVRLEFFTGGLIDSSMNVLTYWAEY